ncbi:MAG: hypothetical protein ACJAY8_000160 [Sphingobacteriales bacterium]|jgi:hypothetical protein
MVTVKPPMLKCSTVRCIKPLKPQASILSISPSKLRSTDYRRKRIGWVFGESKRDVGESKTLNFRW